MENITIYFFGIIISALLYLFRNKFRKQSKLSPIISPVIFYKNVDNGYKILFDSLYYDMNRKYLEENLNSIFMNRTDGRYVGGYTRRSDEFDSISFSLDTFYDLVRYNKSLKGKFLLNLDKNITLLEINDFFKKALFENLKDKNFFTYDLKETLFPYKETLEMYQEKLNKHGIQIGFFSDCMDSYYLLVFPLSKESAIEQAVSDIGFEYKRKIVFI